ncbi:DUF6635 family protein [Ruegeria hyattellae]|uniref:DUF6635 family protein n=1 Tax=Ruegeria hyattellae TaxID=3233337 RepID=UPI00355B900C
MFSSSTPAVAPYKTDPSSHRDYFADRRAKVDEFVARHFTWPGTLHLHRAALGLDVIRAPMNVVLSPAFVLTRIGSFLCRRIGWNDGADFLASRRILLRTSVARRVEACIVTDLLQLPLARGAAHDPDALSHAVLAAPQFREMIRKRKDTADTEALGHRIACAISEYVGTRSAVAEMTTVICTLSIGALVFQAITPGALSMAPGVAEAMASSTAIAEFPLGQTMGGMWYSLFPAGASPELITATVAGLVMTGSVVGAFAGVLADPIQSRLGIHRRRLLRLIGTLEVELAGAGYRPFVAHEHFYARLLDLWDAGTSAFRFFRN